MAAATVHVQELPPEAYWTTASAGLSHINVGSGTDLTILELAEMIAEVTGFSGRIETDPSKPDGTPRKLLDISRLSALGWRANIELRDGLREAYAWFVDNYNKVRER